MNSYRTLNVRKWWTQYFYQNNARKIVSNVPNETIKLTKHKSYLEFTDFTLIIYYMPCGISLKYIFLEFPFQYKIKELNKELIERPYSWRIIGVFFQADFHLFNFIYLRYFFWSCHKFCLMVLLDFCPKKRADGVKMTLQFVKYFCKEW